MANMKQAEILYQKIQDKLKGEKGKMVAIDIESGDYFVGDDTHDAYKKAHKKYPSRQFFFKRVGSKTAYVVGTIVS